MIVETGSPNTKEAMACPCCAAPTAGLYLLPLSFLDLEESVRLRKNEALKKKNNNKRPREDEDLGIEAEYLVFSQGRNTVSSTLSDTGNSRTGRWTEEEVTFVDHLIQAFDKGELPLLEGVKLSTFLGDILLCKASRLTKKMKNAVLSTRSFEVAQKPQTSMNKKEDCQVLGALQDSFIGSMQTKVSQLELKFNLVKQWRTYFSNLCVQMGCLNLDATDWIASLEEMERKASKVEEQMRLVRRRRMGLSTKWNTANQPPMKSTRSEPIVHHDFSSTSIPNIVLSSSDPLLAHHDLDNDFASLYDSSASNTHTLFEEEKVKTTSPPMQSTDPFLEAVSRYMEKSSMPFQHADVWVPSFTNGNGEQVHLLHAGHATRQDQGGKLLSKFADFGEFSKSFTFQPNQGLPGRAYSSGKSQWEVQLSNPALFPRYRGAKAFGLRTATAIPISTPGVSRLIVVFYSMTKLMEDPSLVTRCVAELSSYSPTPKWKLVIEIGNKMLPQVSSEERAVPVQKGNTGAADEVVQRIIDLLGNEMPVGDVSPSSQDLLPHFMAIRLLLLRSSANRTAEEIDIINILKGSFTSYSKDTQRSASELARLLATEYMCLKSAAAPSSHAVAPPQQPPRDQQRNMPARVYSSTQLVVPRAGRLPLFAASGMQGPPTRLPNVVSHCNSTNDMSAMGRTVSMTGMALPTNIFSIPDLSGFNEQAPSF
jgi:hypothetical protein